MGFSKQHQFIVWIFCEPLRGEEREIYREKKRERERERERGGRGVIVG